MAVELKFELHDAQRQIYNSPALFKVVAAGRRFGKTYLAAIACIIEALRTKNSRGYDLDEDSEVMYIAPTFDQAKGIFWPVLKMLARPITAKTQENIGVLTLTNGVRIRLKGTDKEDRARGFKLRYCVLDEYADMSARVWDEVILAALADVEGGALFIGTPKGKNHFWELFQQAKDDESGDWAAFNFSTKDNPFISSSAISRLTRNMSSEIEKQEVYASFQSGGGKYFKEEWFKLTDQEPVGGQWYIAVDLSGFVTSTGTSKSKLSSRDEHAIAVVKVTPDGWWVKDIIHGYWDVREAALRIVKAAADVGPATVGIESGALKNAVLPYMEDEMRRLNRWFNIAPLSHGGTKKDMRIQWALQGRAEKGRLMLNPRPYAIKLIEQALDFPSPLAHDDLLDALAYIDQLSVTSYGPSEAEDYWEPIDLVAGY